MWRTTAAFACLLLCSNAAFGQNTYQSIVRDTIVTLHKFPTTTYLLDGKKLNLSVMDWFMTDYPAAHDQINLSILTEQVSVASYSVGALFGLTGLLVNQQDPHLGNDLLGLGSIGLGSGIVFHIFSGIFKKKAVRLYNEDVRMLYKTGENSRVNVKFDANGFGFRLRLK